MKHCHKKGFTLLELLIVIGILAILATVSILVINPAELLRRSRDSQRISDLSTIKSAIGLYLTDVSSPDLDHVTATTCATYVIASIPSTGGATLAGSCNQPAIATVKYSTTTSYTAVDGTGWVGVNFSSVTGGSPLGSLPIDPTNACADNAAANHLYYTYSCNNTALTFLLTGRMESTMYKVTNDIMSKDGGTATSVYETGTDMSQFGGATTSYRQVASW